MNQFRIESLFPTAVVASNIQRQWTQQELAFLAYQSQFTHNNMGNTTSNNRYVLNSPELYGITEYISQGIQFYVDKIICPKNPIEFYITQSWLNYTKPGQYHHTHQHPNSIISGVIYIDADPEKDKIVFSNPRYKQISIAQSEFNVYNSDSWFFNVGTGDMFLFPSHFTHNVEAKEGQNTRTSLAFNVFAKGYIGEEESLTALHLG